MPTYFTDNREIGKLEKNLKAMAVSNKSEKKCHDYKKCLNYNPRNDLCQTNQGYCETFYNQEERRFH